MNAKHIVSRNARLSNHRRAVHRLTASNSVSSLVQTSWSRRLRENHPPSGNAKKPSDAVRRCVPASPRESGASTILISFSTAKLTAPMLWTARPTSIQRPPSISIVLETDSSCTAQVVYLSLQGNSVQYFWHSILDGLVLCWMKEVVTTVSASTVPPLQSLSIRTTLSYTDILYSSCPQSLALFTSGRCWDSQRACFIFFLL